MGNTTCKRANDLYPLRPLKLGFKLSLLREYKISAPLFQKKIGLSKEGDKIASELLTNAQLKPYPDSL